MAEYIWTDQQKTIFEWFRSGKGHLVVEALAGSAKTTTILEGVRYAPEPSTVICAFNTRIADELKTKTAKTPPPKNKVVETRTLHSLGLRIVNHHWPGVQAHRKRSEELAKQAFEKRGRRPFYKGTKTLVNLMTMVKDVSPLAYDPGTIHRVGWDFDMFLEGDRRFDIQLQCEMVSSMIEDSKQKSGVIDFCDMIWLPIVQNWEFPQRYKLVVVDEAQDLSPAQMTLCKKLSVGRMAFIGDPQQAMYSWRGATSHNMTKLKEELAATSLPLTTTFRCSKAVVAEAKRLVPAFTAMETAPDGGVTTIEYDDLLSAVCPGDFVLSRVNAPLASLCLRLLREKISARVEGKDVYDSAKELWDKFRDAPSVAEFKRRLQGWLEGEIKAAQKENSPHREERARDKSDMLMLLCQEAGSVPEIMGLLTRIFNTSEDAVVCSTVHKAKGLERDRVFVLKETLSQYDWRYNGKPIHHEEYNIEYVAITRAKLELIWVTGGAGASSRKEPPVDDELAALRAAL